MSLYDLYRKSYFRRLLKTLVQLNTTPNMQTLQSSITAVTVFSDRAAITRTAQINLEAGEHRLLFDLLPDTIDQKSIQVSGLGNAILSNVKFKKEFYVEIPDEEENKEIYTEKKRITDEVDKVLQIIARLDKEKKLIEDIAKKVTTPTEKGDPTELDPAKWSKLIDFYREKTIAIDAESFAAQEEKLNLNAQKKRIENKINELGNQKNKEKRQVEVIVEMKSAGDLVLELSYIVRNASWIPVYDMRVNTERKQMNITYNAIIKQSTGENWDEVKLKISTAKPQVSGNEPKLNPWRIDVAMVYQEIQDNIRMGGGGLKKSASIAQNINVQNQLLSVPASDMDRMLAEPQIMEKPSTQVETNATAVFFAISGNHTIKSDNTDHKVTILVEDFPAHFRYSATPKLSPYAYLKARVTNTSAYPFLAGETNVFLDNNFVANANMEAVAPSEEFWTFLGIDEGMKVEHKFLKKYEKQEGGFISKKTKLIVYEYQIKVKNHKKTQEEIVIWDQLPISQNANIKVHLIEPMYKEDTETLKKNEFEALKWFYKPKPMEEILINFKFSVEYPHDSQITGL